MEDLEKSGSNEHVSVVELDHSSTINSTMEFSCSEDIIDSVVSPVEDAEGSFEPQYEANSGLAISPLKPNQTVSNATDITSPA